VWDLVDNIQFLDGNLVNFVQNVHAGDIDTVAVTSNLMACVNMDTQEDQGTLLTEINYLLFLPFDNINQVICGVISFEGDVGVVDFVFGKDSFDRIGVQVCQRYRGSNVDTALFLLSENDGWWLFVETDTETFQFTFNDLFVAQGFQDVQDNKNERASTSDSYDLHLSKPLK
jgi:hypothetical protein